MCTAFVYRPAPSADARETKIRDTTLATRMANDDANKGENPDLNNGFLGNNTLGEYITKWCIENS